MDEVVIKTEEPEQQEGITQADVVVAVEEALHRDKVEESLEELKDGADTKWTILETQMMSLSERVQGIETTLLTLMPVVTQIDEDLMELEQELVDSEEDSSPEEIVLEPEPEPEPEPEQEQGFRPLKSLFGNHG